MSKLIFDIETVGEDFESFDEKTKENLTRWLSEEELGEKTYIAKIKEVKESLGLSPLTGQIVAIGVLDSEKDKGGVYFQAPGLELKEKQEDGINFVPCGEKEILEKFWQIANHYQEFVSFNGRFFDAPYMMLRSAIHGVVPTKDLLSNRFLNNQKFDCKHFDLQDLLSFYGATMNRGRSLHMYCRAFGIKSPKEDGVSGDEVGRLFKEGKYLEIAKYNVRDIKATRELFLRWEKYLRF